MGFPPVGEVLHTLTKTDVKLEGRDSVIGLAADCCAVIQQVVAGVAFGHLCDGVPHKLDVPDHFGE